MTVSGKGTCKWGTSRRVLCSGARPAASSAIFAAATARSTAASSSPAAPRCIRSCKSWSRGRCATRDFIRHPGEGRDLNVTLFRNGEIPRSEEHTSELQSLMRISYAVFCLKKKKRTQDNNTQPILHIQLDHNTKNDQHMTQ